MKQKVYDLLESLGIEYIIHEHEPLFTCEQAQKIFGHIETGQAKNLFVKNKKGSKLLLVVVEDHKKVNLKQLGKDLFVGGLSFASPDRLMQYLGVQPGHVSPFALLNDEDKLVKLYIDEDLLKSEKIYFHPNDNTITLELFTKDFLNYIDHIGYEFESIKINEV